MNFFTVIAFILNSVLSDADYLDNFKTGRDHQGLIVGGEKAKQKQFPYQVCLRIKLESKRSTLCGGTLISNQWIVTAAHCTEKVKHIEAHLGALNRTDLSEAGHKVVLVPKENILSHKNYNSNGKVHDISLLKLPDPVELNDYVQPAKLPKMKGSPSYVNEKAITSGWGQRGDFDFKGSDILLWIDVPILDNADCKRIFPSLKETHICINTTGTKSTCFGDSGGPLVLADGSTTLIGVLSFGMCSCEREYPEVFTRITSYLDWIKNKTGIANE